MPRLIAILAGLSCAATLVGAPHTVAQPGTLQPERVAQETVTINSGRLKLVGPTQARPALRGPAPAAGAASSVPVQTAGAISLFSQAAGGPRQALASASDRSGPRSPLASAARQTNAAA